MILTSNWTTYQIFATLTFPRGNLARKSALWLVSPKRNSDSGATVTFALENCAAMSAL